MAPAVSRLTNQSGVERLRKSTTALERRARQDSQSPSPGNQTNKQRHKPALICLWLSDHPLRCIIMLMHKTFRLTTCFLANHVTVYIGGHQNFIRTQ